MNSFRLIHNPSNIFNHESLNIAVRVICETYRVPSYLVRDVLQDVCIFDQDKSKYSAERIINLWEDHCAEQFLIDCEEYGIAA